MDSRILFLPVSFLSFLLGVFIYRQPVRMIRLQQKFYEKINWRMEPVSMAKEIRNTRWMGGFLIISTLAAVVYYLKA